MHEQQMVSQINDAIGAHGMWKMRLRTAINSGIGDIRSEQACRDDKCAFGQWIHGPTIDAATRAGVPYQVIRRLHAEFHQSAGAVLACVERGDRDRAADLLAGDYTARSEKLVRGLTKWKHELLAQVSAFV